VDKPHVEPTPEEAYERLSHYHRAKHHFHKGVDMCARSGRIVIAGAGFLADAYDLFVINIALMMMQQNPSYGTLDRDTKTQVSLMAVVGALCGQVLFGLCGDQFGRKWTFIATAALTIFGTILQACAQPTSSGMTIWQQMMLFRFIMGVGVGGEYPMASTVTSEGSKDADRGRNLAAVFAMQGVGRILCAVVLLFSAYMIDDPNWQWRFAILFGAVPMMGCIGFRWMPESEAYEEAMGESVPPAERLKVIGNTVWDNRKKLLGTAGSWFILDVVFYGNSLFSADVTAAMGGKHTIKSECISNLWIQLMAMPGYIIGMLLIDKMGRKRMQCFGFTGEAIVFIIMAIFFQKLKDIKVLFIFLYALTFFFDDCGPNLTTFVIPAEIYPTQSRSTCHGISAAMGKAGAAVGATVFNMVTNWYCPGGFCDKNAPEDLVDKGVKTVFWVCAGLALLGLTWTYVLVDDTPHDSLHTVEAAYEIDREKPGEVVELEGIVMKAMESGRFPNPEQQAKDEAALDKAETKNQKQ